MRQPRPKADAGLGTHWGEWPQRRGCSARGHQTGHSCHPSQVPPLVASPTHARPLHSILSRPPWAPPPKPPACHCPAFTTDALPRCRHCSLRKLDSFHRAKVKKGHRAEQKSGLPAGPPAPGTCPQGLRCLSASPARELPGPTEAVGKEVRIGCAGGEGSESGGGSEMEGEGWRQEGV